MKPVKSYAGTIEGSLDAEQIIEMELDDTPEGRAHILSLMTDMYSDFELACIREYSTNARDSMIDAGKSHLPIKVTTPTSLSPHLTIVDEGLGLSIDDLTNVFSKYGASTKRGSDLVNGMLGIGGKAALTYTSQFMVTAVKDGVKAQIVVTRNEDGVGQMEVVDTRATREPNGVEIKIPSKTGNEFATKAERFFYYWQPGTVLLNGKQPTHMVAEEGHTKIGDRIILVKDNRRNSWKRADDIIVMGNVAYPLTGDNSRAFSDIATEAYDISCVVFMDMGEITFAPSREAVAYTARTMAAIDRYKDAIKANIKAQIKNDLANAKSYSEAFTFWNKWGGIVGYKNLPDMDYQGHKFVDNIQANYGYLNLGSHSRWNTAPGTGQNIGGEVTNRRLPMSAAFDDNSVFIVNYPNNNPPAGGSREKLQLHLDGIGKSTAVVYLFPEGMAGSPWTDEVETIDWEDIKSITLAPVVRSGKTGKIPVVVYSSDIAEYFSNWGTSDPRCYGKWETKPLDPNHPIVYVSPADINDRYAGYGTRNKIDTIHRWDKNIQIVRLGANRHDKFVKDNPTARPLVAFHDIDLPKIIQDSLTEDEKKWASYDGDYHKAAKNLKGLTDDPEIEELAKIKARGVDENRTSMYNGTRKVFSKTYPLAPWPGSLTRAGTEKDHTVLYINAVVKEGK